MLPTTLPVVTTPVSCLLSLPEIVARLWILPVLNS
uniref:Uncharacterized protein n=1 Tax=Arundo donax TaxID=35708 RepID=A0A0A9FHK3_ARUDO